MPIAVAARVLILVLSLGVASTSVASGQGQERESEPEAATHSELPLPPAATATSAHAPLPLQKAAAMPMRPAATLEPEAIPAGSRAAPGRLGPPRDPLALGARTKITVIPPEPSGHWYGWQPILTDLIAIGAAASAGIAERERDQAGIGLGSVSLIVLAGAIYAASSPIIHLGNAHANAVTPSIALRLGLPIGGLLSGTLIAIPVSAATCQMESCGPVIVGGALVGLVAGLLAAMIVDASSLSWTSPVDPLASGETSEPDTERVLGEGILVESRLNREGP